MNEYIPFRALFFVVNILAALIITAFAFGISLLSQSRLKTKQKKKAVIARKSIPIAKSGSNREDPFPGPAS